VINYRLEVKACESGKNTLIVDAPTAGGGLLSLRGDSAFPLHLSLYFILVGM